MIAVLTGDLVHSSKMSRHTLTSSQHELNRMIEFLSERYQAQGELYRGDSFQIILPQPAHAARSAILLICALKTNARLDHPVDTTLSIGIGGYKFLDDQLSLSQGQAFELSGRGLDNSERGALSLHCADDTQQKYLQLLTQFVSFQLSGITRKQAEVLYLYVTMEFPEHQLIADELKVSRQNVTKHLKRCGAELIRDYILLFEQHLEELP
ncbi:MarR family transcriptional regulator [Aliidiomarina minuta]|uniref:MarR family transcriptional regulator n=1 Tax=Aliidiomarina minuta TaxID=880057 RepID=A0A432W855_9GAMM|nr:MarR family transcriptional regulator [Aliidiomarina minuta]RUO26297.1 MarR family transcriptional regulator [Aliidiomarina minuta]